MSPKSTIQISCDHADTVARVLTERAARTPTDIAYQYKRNSEWHSSDWLGFQRAAAAVAAGLVELGLKPGDSMAVLGPTAPRWAHQDFGGQMAGLVTLGIYPLQTAEQVAYILEHSRSKVIFVANEEEMETVLSAVKDNKNLQAVVPWTRDIYQQFKDRDSRICSPEVFEGDPLDPQVIDAIQDELDVHATSILIYTSGTTGPPKGAMITHHNIICMLKMLAGASDMVPGDSALSFLPMCHVTQRIMGFYHMVSMGITCAYATSIGAVLGELQEIKPTIFGSVPRLFEKAYNKVQDEIAKKGGAVAGLFRWATNVGVRRVRLLHQGKTPSSWLTFQHKLASALVFKKIRAAFGGNVRVCYTGAAPIALEILELFWAADMPIYEAYGMTEATVVTHVNTPDRVRLGTVGQVMPGLEMILAPDGEILIRGETVFKGYLNNEKETAETLRDGWLHTGDIGEVDQDGFLRITDRKKHIIVTAGGKNVAPANIERAIKNQSPLISHVHAHGDRRPYIAAIIAPSPLETLEWGVARGCLEQGRMEQLRDQLLANPAARSEALNSAMSSIADHSEFAPCFLEPVQRGNQLLARVERVKRFRVLGRDFSQEGGEMTPTMKLKRKAVEEHYGDVFDQIYDDPAFALDAEPASE